MSKQAEAHAGQHVDERDEHDDHPKRGGGHVHLKVAAAPTTKPKWDWARWLVVVLAAAGVALFALSFSKPWWAFTLYAPQYPKGLELVISLTGMGGDVHEIDLLNHYIGMSHLADAAPTERQIAGWGVAGIGVVVMALSLLSGKKLNKIVAIPAIAFPLVFLADSYYWLYKFGHDLDPKAPLHTSIKPFTPQMFGNGKIGQFETFAHPDLGFWLALGGVACVVIAVVLRSRVCANCGRASECGALCPRAMVLPERKAPSKTAGAET